MNRTKRGLTDQRALTQSLFFFLENDIDTQAGREQQGRSICAGAGQVCERNNVIIGGGEKLFAQAGPFLGYGANFTAMLVEESEIPAFPIAFDLGDLLFLAVED